MKPVGVILIVFVLYPSCEGLFLPPLTQGIHSMFGLNYGANSQRPKFIIGTTSELRQVRERFPDIDPSRFIDTTAAEAGRVPQPFALGVNVAYGQQPMKHLGAYAQPAEEPEAPAPAYGMPTSSYGKPQPSYAKPEPSYGKPASSYPKPASSYPRPAASSSYGQPEQPVDQGEPQPVPEAADLPSVNEVSASNWVSQTSSDDVFTETVNQTSISQTATSSSSAASISQTASISDNAESSDSEGGSSQTSESSPDSQQSEDGSNSVLQDVSVQQTGPKESNTDFFPAQLPASETVPPLTSDNVIRPASRPPSTPNQEAASENTVDVGNSADNMPSSQNGDSSSSVNQEASVEQDVSDASDSGSVPMPSNPPFVSDNVIRPASRPVSSPDSMATPENTMSGGNEDNTDPAPSGANAEIAQSASADSGSIVQDASIEQTIDDGASTPVAAENSESPVIESDSSSSGEQQVESEASAGENDSQSSTSGPDVFVVNHSKSESSFNETKTSHNLTKETSTTIVTTHVAGAPPAAFEQIPVTKHRHPFLNQAHKILTNKLPRPGFGRLIRRSADLKEGDVVDAPQNPVDVEEAAGEESAAEEETELDLRQLADNYPVLEKQEDIEDYFTYISNIDTDHCLAKTICELASNPEKKGTEGVQIDEFFEKYDATNSKEGMKMYKDAHLAGKGGEETCLARFPDCKLDE